MNKNIIKIYLNFNYKKNKNNSYNISKNKILNKYYIFQ